MSNKNKNEKKQKKPGANTFPTRKRNLFLNEWGAYCSNCGTLICGASSRQLLPNEVECDCAILKTKEEIADSSTDFETN